MLLMKFHAIKLPSMTHHNVYLLPVAVLAACLLILAIVNVSDRGTLLPPATTSRPVRHGERCNIFKGGWVPDPAAPYYISDTCSVIHGHYDCMKHGKPDLGFVKWRWRPAECELPRFDPARFLAAMKGKSMAFVGDSLARNQMHSLICLLTRADLPESRTDPTQSHVHSTAYYYKNHGFTVSAFWSPYLVRAAEIDQDGPARTGSGLWSLRLDEPDAGWAVRVGEFDHVVISASSWFYRPTMFYERGRLIGCNGCLVPNVTDLTLRYSLRAALRSALLAAVTAAGERTVVVRTMTPSHYENGTWDGGGDCARTRPLLGGEAAMDSVQREVYDIQVEEFKKAAAAVRGQGVRLKLLDVTDAMALRPDGHPGKYRLWEPDKVRVSSDCVHWCLPGAMDACNDMLLHMLLA